MRSRLRSTLLLLLLLGAALPAAAQVPQYPETVRAAVHRIFASRDFASQRFGPARFIDGGAEYTTVERSTETGGGSDIVKYVTATGARRVLVAARAMVPAGATTPLRFDNYSWSADGTKLLLFTNTERVWRENTRGDYWVLTLATGQLMKLGGDAPTSSLMYAKFSPAGDRVAYVSRSGYRRARRQGTRCLDAEFRALWQIASGRSGPFAAHATAATAKRLGQAPDPISAGCEGCCRT